MKTALASYWLLCVALLSLHWNSVLMSVNARDALESVTDLMTYCLFSHCTILNIVYFYIFELSCKFNYLPHQINHVALLLYLYILYIACVLLIMDTFLYTIKSDQFLDGWSTMGLFSWYVIFYMFSNFIRYDMQLCGLNPKQLILSELFLESAINVK